MLNKPVFTRVGDPRCVTQNGKRNLWQNGCRVVIYTIRWDQLQEHPMTNTMTPAMQMLAEMIKGGIVFTARHGLCVAQGKHRDKVIVPGE